MIKVIKYGFRSINNHRQRGQNMSKGQKLFEAGHVLEVEEIINEENDAVITGKIVAQTKISNVYDVKIMMTMSSINRVHDSDWRCQLAAPSLCTFPIWQDKKTMSNSPSTLKALSSHSVEENTPATFHWESGIVPYTISPDYDDIIANRIRAAMHTIESTSCVVFKDMEVDPLPQERATSAWLSIQNPEGIRECSHTTLHEEGTITISSKAILILGYDCMRRRDILHALLHALGFRDEVTHPQRDMYIRIIWPNIQPKYRSLFWMRTADTPHKMVEYDSLSIMHFHDRAYSMNGGATITPVISGLLIAPSDKLSQLDVMKLRLAFGHECNKRKVGNLLQTCQNALQQSDHDEETEKSEEGTD